MKVTKEGNERLIIQEKVKEEEIIGNNKKCDFSIEITNVLKRIVGQIEKTIKSKGQKIGAIVDSYTFPLSKKTWYNYKEGKVVSNFRVGTLYDICNYTDVSADYYLGFNTSLRKEASSSQIQKDYGLSDESLNILAKLRNYTDQNMSRYNGLSDIDFVNRLITDFSPKFLAYIINYFYAKDALEEYENEYFDEKRRLRKEWIDEEERIISKYQELIDAVDVEKYKLIQDVGRFVDNLRQSINGNEEDEEEQDQRIDDFFESETC